MKHLSWLPITALLGSLMLGCQTQSTSSSDQSQSQSHQGDAAQSPGATAEQTSAAPIPPGTDTNEPNPASSSVGAHSVGEPDATPHTTDPQGTASSTTSDNTTADVAHSNASSSNSTHSSTTGAATHEETLGTLDERLAASVGEFDRMILTERSRISSGTGGDDASGGDYGGGGGGDHDDGPGAAGGSAFDEGEPLGGDSMGESTGPGMDGTGSNSSKHSVNGGRTGQAGAAGRLPGRGDDEHADIPGDIPSGEDDDIVARQIREAAIDEPDPELREKLWDEYRRYKGLK